MSDAFTSVISTPSCHGYQAQQDRLNLWDTVGLFTVTITV